MMKQHVLIYKPAKTAMQSGRAKTRKWVLKHDVDSPVVPDRLMGWQSGFDTRRQIELHFDSKEEAIAYAKEKNMSYTVREPHVRTFKSKSYARNFTKPVLDN